MYSSAACHRQLDCRSGRPQLTTVLHEQPLDRGRGNFRHVAPRPRNRSLVRVLGFPAGALPSTARAFSSRCRKSTTRRAIRSRSRSTGSTWRGVLEPVELVLARRESRAGCARRCAGARSDRAGCRSAAPAPARRPARARPRAPSLQQLVHRAQRHAVVARVTRARLVVEDRRGLGQRAHERPAAAAPRVRTSRPRSSGAARTTAPAHAAAAARARARARPPSESPSTYTRACRSASASYAPTTASIQALRDSRRSSACDRAVAGQERALAVEARGSRAPRRAAAPRRACRSGRACTAPPARRRRARRRAGRRSPSAFTRARRAARRSRRARDGRDRHAVAARGARARLVLGLHAPAVPSAPRELHADRAHTGCRPSRAPRARTSRGTRWMRTPSALESDEHAPRQPIGVGRAARARAGAAPAAPSS